MKNIYWMDEIHPTEIEYKILFEVQEGQTMKLYHAEPMILVYFVGIRILCSWLFLNFTQLLRTILDLEIQRYIPLAHVNSVGLSVEFCHGIEAIAIYADSWDLGKHHRVVLQNWNNIKPTSKGFKGSIGFDAPEIKVNAWTGKMHTAVCEMEYNYRFYKIEKSNILNVEIKTL